ncbi:MAG: transcriptional repressor [Paludibacteraceae bacterium]|nr:transcriptional repressor [Paludibacteraceae bacterium]
MIFSDKVSKTKVEEYLRAHNIRPSIQRMAVMEYLANHRTHPSINDIYRALHPTVSTLSRTTVYNTLHLLAEAKAVKELSMEDNVCYYDADTSNHAHYKCRQCCKIYDLFETEIPLLAEIKKLVENDSRFDSADLYFRGICPKCAEKEERKKKQKFI